MKKFVLFFLFGIMTCFFAGCGYTTSSLLPSNIKTIYIAPFKNEIEYTQESNRNVYFPLMEVKIREAVVNRYLFDGHLTVVDQGSSDLTLEGKLVGYNRYALRYSDQDSDEEMMSIRVVEVTGNGPQQ